MSPTNNQYSTQAERAIAAQNFAQRLFAVLLKRFLLKQNIFWSQPENLSAYGRLLQEKYAVKYAEKNMQKYMEKWGEMFNKGPLAVLDSIKDNNSKKAAGFFGSLGQDWQANNEIVYATIRETIDAYEAGCKKEQLTYCDLALLRFFYDNVFAASNVSNLPFFNDEFWIEAIKSNNQSVKSGLENWSSDLQNYQDSGHFQLNTTPLKHFVLGRDIAATPGKVVYRNELLELIQYEPSTDMVHETPILICPAWINKYYVLDLQPENSFVKWLVDQGHTVFIISWRNPSQDNCEQQFADYIEQGTVPALEAVLMVTGATKANCIGYCLGGTVMAMTAAYLQAKKLDYIASLVFLSSLVDFAECGIIGAFINEEAIEAIDEHIDEVGYLSGKCLFSTFSAIRPKEMVWYYFINSYLLGKEPRPLAVLQWNADSTNMAGPAHKYYLRRLYLENELIKGQLQIGGQPINLQDISLPIYSVATTEDHIAPWRSVYTGLQLAYKGSKIKRFILGESGHVMGIINSPRAKRQYAHYMFDNPDFLCGGLGGTVTCQANPPAVDQLSAAEWREQAKRVDESWWLDLDRWLDGIETAGEKVVARQVQLVDESGGAAAPGQYVRE